MIRARAKAIHDKVNSFLYTLEIDHTVNGSLPHSNAICVIRYEPHETSTEDKDHDEEAWKHHKEAAASG
jgi:hypothetical protein